MTITTPRRRLGLAAAVALTGGLVVSGMPGASAATSGNLETKGPTYYCASGSPQAVIYVRTTGSAESVSYSSKRGSATIGTLTPSKNYGYIYTRGATFAGTEITVTFRGAETGSRLAVTAKIPSSCNGLPTGRPGSGWAGSAVGPTDPGEKEQPAPEKPKPPKQAGPPVQTGYVGDDSSNTATLALLGLFATGVAVTGAAASRRIAKR